MRIKFKFSSCKNSAFILFAAALGAEGNTFLMAYNESKTTEGSYEMEVVE